jgi:hypothetical protein
LGGMRSTALFLLVLCACSSDPAASADPQKGPTGNGNDPAHPGGSTDSGVDNGTLPDGGTDPTKPAGNGHFATLPVGSALPTDSDCAARVRPTAEIHADNATANATKGTGPNGRFPRVTGNFSGTTDEILQWAACKWGIDEDLVRAQAVAETNWHQSGKGNLTSNQSDCYPAVRTQSGQCPESLGILQVRYVYHMEAFKDGNALLSTAYNADYTYATWRSCFEGKETWLNGGGGKPYAAGDAAGCIGLWYAGAWHTSDAEGYIKDVEDIVAKKTWTTAAFKSL